MISTENELINYKTKFFNSKHIAYSDTTTEKGGSNSGFRPHELLEAALATCINMQIRIYAESHNLKLSKVKVMVKLNRNIIESSIFEYRIEVEGNLSEIERKKIMSVAETCPVKKTLSKEIKFKRVK